MSINVAAKKSGGRQAEAPAQAPRSARRQTWLDALRGMAALIVLFEHLLDPLFPEVRTAVSPWFDFGQYGVMLFFLVSGYVVPASLERRGSVTSFWISRMFRLYPLWIVVAVAGTLFGLLQVYWGLPSQLSGHPITSAIAHLTMLQDLLQVVSVVNVFWTLTYEMVFCLLVTAIFAVGTHRVRTGGVLVVAMAGVLVGGVLPAGALSRGLGGDVVVVGATVVLLLGLGAILGGGHRVRVTGAVVVAAVVLVLLGANSRVGAWESLAIVATLFAGTAFWRIDQGQVNRRVTGMLIALVPVVSIAAAFWFGPGWEMPEEKALAFRWSWSAAVAGAWLTFLIGRLLRSSALPRVLVRLGLISYSLYLLHPLAVQVLRRLMPDPSPVPLAERIAAFAVLLGVVVACSAVTYRFIERPTQELGRRLAR